MEDEVTREEFCEKWQAAETMREFCQATGLTHWQATSRAARYRNHGADLKHFKARTPRNKNAKDVTYCGDKVFDKLCEAHGLPLPDSEVRFHPTRKWRADHVWGDHDLILEIEGGAWIQGRHNRALGFIKDMEKYNEMAIEGYRLLRCTPKDVETGRVFDWIRRAIYGSDEPVR